MSNVFIGAVAILPPIQADYHLIITIELRYAALTLMNIEKGFHSLIKKKVICHGK